MKKPGLAALLLLAGAVSQPCAAQGNLSYDQAVVYCKSLGELARSIMEARQQDVDPNDQLKTLEAMDNDHWEQLGAKLVSVAYQHPEYEGAARQKRAIEEFRNEYEQACYKMYLK